MKKRELGFIPHNVKKKPQLSLALNRLSAADQGAGSSIEATMVPGHDGGAVGAWGPVYLPIWV